MHLCRRSGRGFPFLQGRHHRRLRYRLCRCKGLQRYPACWENYLDLQHQPGGQWVQDGPEAHDQNLSRPLFRRLALVLSRCLALSICRLRLLSCRVSLPCNFVLVLSCSLSRPLFRRLALVLSRCLALSISRRLALVLSRRRSHSRRCPLSLSRRGASLPWLLLPEPRFCSALSVQAYYLCPAIFVQISGKRQNTKECVTICTSTLHKTTIM